MILIICLYNYSTGNTPLMYSSMVGNDTAIEVLAKCFRRLGLNVDHVNDEGLTALIIAAKNGFIECASILSLEGRACISFRDPEKGYTAEEWARLQGCSTEEVLPFSSTLALWQYKLNRKPSMPQEPEELQLFGEVRNCEGQRSFVVERTTDQNTEMVSIDDLTRFFSRSALGNDSHSGSPPEALCQLKKRSSLPAIKFKATQISVSADTRATIAKTPTELLVSIPKSGQRFRPDIRSRSRTPCVPEHSEAEDIKVQDVEHTRASVGTQTDIGDPTRSQSADIVSQLTCGAMIKKMNEEGQSKTTSGTETESAVSTSSMSVFSEESVNSFSGYYAATTRSRTSSTGPQKIGLDIGCDVDPGQLDNDDHY